jgi:hypothetical protein
METEAFDSSYPGLPGQDHSEEFPVSSDAEIWCHFWCHLLSYFQAFPCDTL